MQTSSELGCTPNDYSSGTDFIESPFEAGKKSISNRFFVGDIEVYSCKPCVEPADSVSLIFVHGAYMGAWCWNEFFLPYFAAQGYQAYALSLAGHGGSGGREYIDFISINDYVKNLRSVVSSLPTKHILIGHSMGGLVVQKYLENEKSNGVVLMASVPPQGLLGPSLTLSLTNPWLLAELNRLLGGGVPLPSSLRDALFFQDISDENLLRYYGQVQPESSRAIWDMSLFNLPEVKKMTEQPILVLGGEHDNLIPPAFVLSTASAFGVEPIIFDDMGHGLMLEKGWQKVADSILAWIQQSGLYVK